jgi:hypothetical protein
MAVVVSVGVVSASSAAAANWPPWRSLSRGVGGISVPGGGQAGAALIPTRNALDRFPVLMLHPGHAGCCDWYDTFEWTHDAVLLVVARMPAEFAIYGLTRRRETLHVRIGPRYPGQPATPAASTYTPWLTVDVRKRLLGKFFGAFVRVRAAHTRIRVRGWPGWRSGSGRRGDQGAHRAAHRSRAGGPASLPSRGLRHPAVQSVVRTCARAHQAHSGVLESATFACSSGYSAGR